MKTFLAGLMTLFLTAPVLAEPNPAGTDGPILSTKSARTFYENEWKFAEAYRAGDYIFISGKVIGPREGEARDIEGFKEQTRRVFTSIQGTLQAGGASMDDIVMIRSFHVFDSPFFEGSKFDQMLAFQAVKAEFIPEPHPAQTSVGVAELIPDNGIVEVEIIAHVPATGGTPKPMH